MAQPQEVMQTSNIERRTPNAELGTAPSEFDVGRSALGVRRFSGIVMRILDFIIAAIFILAGLTKILAMDQLLTDLSHFHLERFAAGIQQISIADPNVFARDIDNYKMLPWPVAVGLAFYLPWLEVLCGLALIFRRLYRGSLLILSGLTIVFIVATVVAKARGLDISCGCFGHVSQGWSFGWHMMLDLCLLAALAALCAQAWADGRRTVS